MKNFIKKLMLILSVTISFISIGALLNKINANNVSYENGNVIMIDVARRDMNEQQIKGIIDNINPNKFQHLQLHLNDNSNFAIKTNILNNEGSNSALSINQLSQIVKYANDKGITIVPGIDLPSHSKVLVDYIKRDGLLDNNCIMNNNTLDYTNEEAIRFVEHLYRGILPAFDNQQNKCFMIGIDEVPGDKANANDLDNYIGQLNNYLNIFSFNTIIWNDSLNNNSLSNLPRNIIVDYWKNTGLSINDIKNHGNLIKNVNYQDNYFNIGDLNNQQLKDEKIKKFVNQKGPKMLCLWSNDSRDKQISNQQIIDYIKEVQNNMN